jgi:class 3 adenylate cyclase/tetratricopeptide (TPR) repeat protein
MPSCPSCGRRFQAPARFCADCGVPLTVEDPADREVRKTVTIVFSDLVGSTALGERLDPEPLREVMTRFYDTAAEVLTRHGGTVAKFIGDAVMAVFGVPRLREDDALRAVRAAAELGPALDELNRELESGWGVRLTLRTGVNTGEVVTGASVHGQDLAVGDAVNVAARLEQAAAPGEVLIGEATRLLVRDAVTTEPAALPPLKGKETAVVAHRVLDVIPGAPGRTRHLDAPMVGRAAELARLTAVLDEAEAARACRAALVTGPAGVGKSRLVHELVTAASGRAAVLTGRCREYGDAVTYWPVREIVRQAAGPGGDVEAALRELLAGQEQAVALARQVAGMAEGADVSVREYPWALRRLLEAMARARPVIVVLDDLHAAEPALLDLVEQVATTLHDAPVLLCGTARPELLTTRPDWLAPVHIPLEPLDQPDAALLVDHLLGAGTGGGLPGAAKYRLWQAAGGNPLFLEELVAKLRDDGVLTRARGQWTSELATVGVPPTISALLAARLEQLDDQRRAVLERGSVVGQPFDVSALTALTPEPERAGLPGHLAGLVADGLLTADGPDSYRFRHLLLRDAAYASLPKRRRVLLHERLAAELEAAGPAGEELTGHHFEQAWRLRTELGPGGRERRDALAARAAFHLAAAGRRALGRDDAAAAVNLLDRAVVLTPELPVLLDLGDALIERGHRDRAGQVIDRVEAEAGDDKPLRQRARIARLYLEEPAGLPGWAARARAGAEEAAAVFTVAGDLAGRANALRLLAHVANLRLRWAELERVGGEVERLARATGDDRTANRMVGGIAAAVAMGPTPVAEALVRCEEMLDQLDGAPRPTVMVLDSIALCHALAGRVDEAVKVLGRADDIRADLAGTLWKVGGRADFSANVWVLLGRPDEAERVLRRSYELLAAIGDRGGPLAIQAAMLAHAIHLQGGRDDEAASYAELSARVTIGDDLLAAVHQRHVRALVEARRGRVEAGIVLLGEAIELAGTGDALGLQGWLRADLAEIQAGAGRPDAAATAATALELVERKGDVVTAARMRALV